jgi:hypothetical protein
VEGSCEHGKEPSGSIKVVAQIVASQEVSSSIDLVI